jgi:hypothetical protein
VRPVSPFPGHTQSLGAPIFRKGIKTQAALDTGEAKQVA